MHQRGSWALSGQHGHYRGMKDSEGLSLARKISAIKAVEQPGEGSESIVEPCDTVDVTNGRRGGTDATNGSRRVEVIQGDPH